MEDQYRWGILLWAPNIIGYFRLILCGLAAVCHQISYNHECIVLYLVSFTLDGIDGFLARKLNQTSVFGAWFDIFVDLVSRGLLWSHIHPTVGYVVMSWEWLTFFSIHTLYGKVWKTPPQAPSFVSYVMKNNFKTPHGFVIVGSLFLLPTYYYMDIYLSYLLPSLCSFHIQSGLLLVLIIGRILAATVEGWYVGQFLMSLLKVDKSE